MRAFTREERPDGDKDGAPASSGVEVISSEHYGVPDSGVDGNVTSAGKCGETGADSTPTAPSGEGSAADIRGGGGDEERKGPPDAAGGGGGDEGRGAESVLGVESPEIMIRPPTYGFNDKVCFGAVYSLPPAGLWVGWNTRAPTCTQI